MGGKRVRDAGSQFSRFVLFLLAAALLSFAAAPSASADRSVIGYYEFDQRVDGEGVRAFSGFSCFQERPETSRGRLRPPSTEPARAGLAPGISTS
jgi:hypothetical protein